MTVLLAWWAVSIPIILIVDIVKDHQQMREPKGWVVIALMTVLGAELLVAYGHAEQVGRQRMEALIRQEPLHERCKAGVPLP